MPQLLREIASSNKYISFLWLFEDSLQLHNDSFIVLINADDVKFPVKLRHFPEVLFHAASIVLQCVLSREVDHVNDSS